VTDNKQISEAQFQRSNSWPIMKCGIGFLNSQLSTEALNELRDHLAFSGLDAQQLKPVSVKRIRTSNSASMF
jgi:hypothetical protein